MKTRFKLFSRAISIVFSSARGLSWSSILLNIASSILPLVLVWCIKILTDSITSAASGDSYHLGRIALAMVIAIALIYFLEEASQAIASLIRKKQSYRVEKHMFSLIHNKSIALDLLHFEDPKYYDTLARASREAPYRPTSIVNNISALLRSSLSLILMAGLLSILNFWLLAILLIANIPGIMLRLHFADQLYNFKKEQSPTARKAAYFNWLLTGDRPSRELRLFGLGKYFASIFNKHFDQQQEEEIKIIRKRSLIELVSGLFKGLAVLLALWYLVNRSLGAWISLGDLAMYLLAFRLGMTFLKQIMSSLAALYEDNLFVADIFEFLSLKEKVVALSPKAEPGEFKESLKINKLSFRYPGSDKDIISELDLEIKKGETLALVGANGAGKTTLARLITRLYDPGEGEILFDKHNIKNIDPAAYRQRYSVLFQDFMLYNMSAGANIAAGDISGMEDNKKISDSAGLAGIDEFIEKLPRGYDTVIGRLFDDSRELSWGEWQKIALARALFRKSEILILDEPASALDAESEYELFKRFESISQDRTTILISHRFSNVSIADRIAVLENGKIRELGTHEELIRLNGKYAELYKLQKSRYQ